MTSFVRQATVTLHVSLAAQTPLDGLDSYQLAGYLKLREYHPFSSNPSTSLSRQSSNLIRSFFPHTFHRTTTESFLSEAPPPDIHLSPPARSLPWYELLTFNSLQALTSPGILSRRYGGLSIIHARCTPSRHVHEKVR
jgi:hypothetical protein